MQGVNHCNSRVGVAVISGVAAGTLGLQHVYVSSNCA